MPETLTRSHKLTALFLIVALGLVLRLRGLGQAGFNEDEVHKVQAARAYLHGDLSANLEHPMLMKSLIAMSLAAADSWKIAELSLLAFIAFGSVLPSAAASVEVKRNGDRIDVLIGGHPFTAYYFGAAAAKPYLFPLRSAQGTVVTRGFPMDPNIPGEDQDEPHQRAMYFAHGDINGYDFWGEVEFPRWNRHSASTFGRTVFRKLDEMKGGPDSGTLRVEFDLVRPDGRVIAAETQAF